MKRKIFYLLLFVIILLIICPFAWQVITSFKGPSEIFSVPLSILPKGIYLNNYSLVFTSGPPFALYILNSLIISGSATLLCLIFGSLCAYSISRLNIKGKKYILASFLMVSMFPQVSVLSPLYLTLRRLGLLNTHIGLILVYTAFALPLCIWLLTNFFNELPKELEEAALIDGLKPLGVLLKIVFPLSAPGIFSSAILVFIYCWNEFLFSLVFNTNVNMRTVTVGITMFPGLYEIPWGTIFAASTIVTIPLLILVFLFQKRIVSGLTQGAIK